MREPPCKLPQAPWALPGMVSAVQLREPTWRAGPIPCRSPPYKRGVRRFKSLLRPQFRIFDSARHNVSRRVGDKPCCTGQDWCGKWMPRKKTTCARTPGHGGLAPASGGTAERLRHVPRAGLRSGNSSTWTMITRAARGRTDRAEGCHPRTPMPYGQHRAGLHRTPICDGSRLPGQSSGPARRGLASNPERRLP